MALVLVTVQPTTLTFGKASGYAQVMKLTNVSPGSVAFKVKITAPHAFTVRPSYGTLGLGSEQSVSITLNAANPFQASGACFLVQAVAVADGQAFAREDWSKCPQASIREHRVAVRLDEGEGGAAEASRPADGGDLKMTYDEWVQYTLHLEEEKKLLEAKTKAGGGGAREEPPTVEGPWKRLQKLFSEQSGQPKASGGEASKAAPKKPLKGARKEAPKKAPEVEGPEEQEKEAAEDGMASLINHEVVLRLQGSGPWTRVQKFFSENTEQARATVASIFHFTGCDPGVEQVTQEQLPVGSMLLRLIVRLQGPCALHMLCDSVLSGIGDHAFTKHFREEGLIDGGSFVIIDQTSFAACYQSAILQLDTPTQYQKDRLADIQRSLRQLQWVNLQGHAGTGKTFLALLCGLEALHADPTANILFVARAQALCLSIRHQLIQRRSNKHPEFLERVWFLTLRADGQAWMRRPCRLLAASADFEEEEAGDATHFALVVVEEAHRLFANGRCGFPEFVDRHASWSRGGLFLTDPSQADEGAIVELQSAGMNIKNVMLTEVVRSSQRIAAGSMAFQVGGPHTEVSCLHESQGPPLTSFIFDTDGDHRYEDYAKHIIEAFEHLWVTYQELSLHDQVLVVCPDSDNAAAAFDVDRLKTMLSRMWPQRRPVNWVSAVQAARMQDSASQTVGPEGERIVLDTIDKMDGLEKLIAICVGLDAPMDGEFIRQARCQLYRGITRAQMIAIVVNEAIPNGWLSFLSHVHMSDGRDLVEKWFDEDKGLFDDMYLDQVKKQKVYTGADKLRQAKKVDTSAKNVRPVKRPWAIFLAGGPGSGKGCVIRLIRARLGLDDTRVVYIDVDKNREDLPEWEADKHFPKLPDTVKATQVEAGFISELMAMRCCHTSRCFIFDATLRNGEVARRFMERLKTVARHGLRICIVMVETHVEVCVKRAKSREQSEGRPVEQSYVRCCNEQSRRTAESFMGDELISLFIRVNNDVNGAEPAFVPAMDLKKLAHFVGEEWNEDHDVARIERLGMVPGAADAAVSRRPAEAAERGSATEAAPVQLQEAQETRRDAAAAEHEAAAISPGSRKGLWSFLFRASSGDSVDAQEENAAVSVPNHAGGAGQALAPAAESAAGQARGQASEGVEPASEGGEQAPAHGPDSDVAEQQAFDQAVALDDEPQGRATKAQRKLIEQYIWDTSHNSAQVCVPDGDVYMPFFDVDEAGSDEEKEKEEEEDAEAPQPTSDDRAQAHEEAIRQLMGRHRSAMRDQKWAHDSAMQHQARAHEEAISQLAIRHENAMRDQARAHEEAISQLEKRHESAQRAMQHQARVHEEAISQLKIRHENAMRDQVRAHEEATSQLEKRHESAQRAQTEAISQLAQKRHESAQRDQARAHAEAICELEKRHESAQREQVRAHEEATSQFVQRHEHVMRGQAQMHQAAVNQLKRKVQELEMPWWEKACKRRKGRRAPYLTKSK